MKSLKKELLSFKNPFFQEFYLFIHHILHPELGQCKQWPLKLPEMGRPLLPKMITGRFRSRVL